MYCFNYIEEEKRVIFKEFMKSHGCSRLTRKTVSGKLDRTTLLHDIMENQYNYELLFQILSNQKGDIDDYRYCEIVKYYELTHKDESEQVKNFYQNMLKFTHQYKKELEEKAEKARLERKSNKYSIQKINYYIENYINSDKSVNDFLKETNITNYMFKEMVNIAKIKNLQIYKKYEKHKEERAKKIGKSFCNFAQEVVDFLSNPENTELDCLLKYNFNVFNLESLIRSFKIKTNYETKRKIKRLKSIQSSNHIQRIRESTYIFHGHELTESEKEQALQLLKTHHISYHEITFKQALKKLEII